MNNRKNKDINALCKKGFQIKYNEEDNNVVLVKFNGPSDTYYKNGAWWVRIEFPNTYPFKSPSVGFKTKIFHPNVDEYSGTVCLDALNQEWTPMYDLSNIFEIFLPQLLTYPNPNDPLNHQASSIYLNNRNKFKETVDKYILDFCNKL